jgi:hypothetical protein
VHRALSLRGVRPDHKHRDSLPASNGPDRFSLDEGDNRSIDRHQSMGHMVQLRESKSSSAAMGWSGGFDHPGQFPSTRTDTRSSTSSRSSSLSPGRQKLSPKSPNTVGGGGGQGGSAEKWVESDILLSPRSKKKWHGACFSTGFCTVEESMIPTTSAGLNHTCDPMFCHSGVPFSYRCHPTFCRNTEGARFRPGAIFGEQTCRNRAERSTKAGWYSLQPQRKYWEQ